MLRAAVPLLLLPLLAPAQPQPGLDPGMKTIVQVAIVTRDIEASAKRWAAVLGLPAPTITTTRPGEEVKVVYRGKPSSGRAKLAFFRLGQVVLELIEPVGGDTSWKQFLDEHGEGVQHLGFQVENLEEAIARAARMGMPVLHRGRYDREDGDYVYIDSEKLLGVTVEFLHSDRRQP